MKFLTGAALTAVLSLGIWGLPSVVRQDAGMLRAENIPGSSSALKQSIDLQEVQQQVLQNPAILQMGQQLLQQNPQFVLQLVQQVLTQNPQLIQQLQQNPQLVQQIAQESPQMIQLLQQNPELVEQLQQLLK